MRSITPLLLLASPLLAAGPKTHKDLSYSPLKHEKQKLDVYAAVSGKDRPVVVWIHGGGWQAGDKAEVRQKPQTFLNKGYVFVSVNYRLLGDKVTIKEMAEDVAQAIAWVRERAKDYGGDPETLVVGGHSAGAQLAALVCTDDRYLKAHGIKLSNIKACFPVDGDTYDVPMQIKTVEERRANIYRKKFGDEASQKELSPVTHVAKGKGIPPILILHVAEHPETKGQSERLVKALTDAGCSAKTHAAAGKDHVTLNDDLGTPDDKPTRALFDFLNGVVKK